MTVCALALAKWIPKNSIRANEDSGLTDYQSQVNDWVQSENSKLKDQIAGEGAKLTNEKDFHVKDPADSTETLAAIPDR
jgi:hypothetical protein